MPNGSVIDALNVSAGVRSVRFDAEEGLYLNEQPLKLRGFCDHSNMGGMNQSGMAGMDHSGMDHAAMDHSQMDHSQHGQMDHATMDIPMGPPPPRAFEGPQHAADLYFHPDRMASARAYNHAAHGGMSTGTMLVERLEARLADGHDAYVWDVSAWYGTSTDTLVFKSEGEGEFGGSVEDELKHRRRPRGAGDAPRPRLRYASP